MTTQQDILLGDDDDLSWADGDIAIGDSLIQEVSIIARLNQGELKSDPLLGPNLITMINAKADPTAIQSKMKVHLARDNKSYDDIKALMNINTKTDE